MSKELEALKTIKNFLGYNYCSVDLPNELKCVENALKRLEAIDNANPSEALEYVENIQSEIEWAFEFNGRKIEEYEPKIFDTIKQALTTKSKKELAFDAIKEKIKYKGLDEYMKEQIVILSKEGEVVLFTPEDKEFELVKEMI